MDLLIPTITWFAISFICQLIVYPFLLRLLPSTIAFGASKTVGIIVFGYLVWVLGLLTGFSLLSLAVGILIFLSVLSYLYVIRRYNRIDWLPLPDKHEMLWLEGFFFASFLTFWALYSTHPEIYWGEKPMDFSFLNYFTRLESLPPTDPWASGSSLGYYYLGTFIIALFQKLSGMASHYGFGIALAHIFALLTVSIASVLLRLGLPLSKAFFCAAIAVLAADYDVLYLWVIVKQKLGFDLYWASSRTLTSPGMNEYPLWSMLFADLHAHVIALPFVATTLLLIINFAYSLLNNDLSRKAEHIVWLGLLWGSLCALNTWDYLGVGVVTGFMFLLLLAVALPCSFKKIWNIAGIGILTLIASIVFSLPFHLTVTSGTKASWGYVYPEEFNTIAQIFRIHGHWLLLLVASFLVSTKFASSSATSFLRSICYVCFAAFPILIGLFTTNIANIPAAPWGVLSLATLICAIGAYYFFHFQELSVRCAGILAIAAGVIYTLAECFFLMDRMNTTFKTYHLIWTLLAISSLTFLNRTFAAIQFSRKATTTLRITAIAVLVPALFAGALCMFMMASFKRIPAPRPTINGTKYLLSFNPNEKEAFEWLNTHVTGTPTIVEAFGPSYQEYSRFSMHTGLPLVLGWEYHVQQRGTKDSEIRKQDVRSIYTASLIKERMQALNKYQTQLIVVGQRERDAYGPEVDRFFAENPDYFSVVYQNASGVTKIYRHRYTSIAIR